MPDSLPVLFFGDFLTASVATIALNPSDQEYTTPDGRLLVGAGQRFATLSSLVAERRDALTDAQCAEAINWMREYFGDAKPIYGWFAHLERFLEGVGFSYRNGSAVHLDLVQEATAPVWSGLQDDDKSVLLDLDLPFLDEQIRLSHFDAIFCNGRTVSDNLCARLGVVIRRRGELRRLRWWTGEATVGGETKVLAG
ncbi:MAG: hypothetical protein QOD06_433 [Candidatus Binatota bacterium]|nr:hypothetical protein [Candidatus Binatota bacterium]